jgi:hypothetical protein
MHPFQPVVASQAVIGTQRRRGFHVWLRRWLRTSKPTEWITSTAQMLAVLTAITTGTIYLLSGTLDSKKAEAETKLAIARLEERNIENRISNLRADQQELEARTKAEREEIRIRRAGLIAAGKAHTEAEEDLTRWANTLVERGAFRASPRATKIEKSIGAKLKEARGKINKPMVSNASYSYVIKRRAS